MRYSRVKSAMTAAFVLTCVVTAAAPAERSWAGDVGAAVGATDLPEVTPQQGSALVDLARTAMTDYLHVRAAPSSVRIPPQLRELVRRPNAVAVTLRRGGSVMAMEVHSAEDLCTNVIIAAFQAMRSPKLPDRVDDKVLAGLTVEVEVLGKPLPIDQGQVDRAVVPGLTGLQCGSGSSTVHVLPSAAYVLGLSPEEMLGKTMQQLQGPAESQLPPGKTNLQLAVFAARHYVGYPDSPAFELHRGKLSPTPPRLDDKAALAAAASVGRYLAEHQEADGWFTVGEGETTLVDQLYATWAVARLAARQPAPALAESVRRALAGAGRKVARNQGRAVVKAGSPDDTLAATALMALAMQADRTKQAVELRRELLAGLTGNLDAPATRPGAGPATSAAARRHGVTRGRCLAAMALATDPACEPFLASARREVLVARPASAEEALWKFRAVPGLAWPISFGDPTAAVGLTQHGQGVPGWGAGQPTSAGTPKPQQGQAIPADDRGGFAAGAQPPDTYLTGLAAMCLVKLLDRPVNPPYMASGYARQLADARRFCANMIYQPREAYFAADPNSWAGAVRAAPGSAAATAPACAAAIEALILTWEP